MKNIQIGKFKITSKKFAVIDLDIVNAAYVSAGMPRIEAIIGGDILKNIRPLLIIARRNSL